MSKNKTKQITIEIPNDHKPVLEWNARHHKKQNDAKKSMRDFRETIFCAGNGAGKTHLLYWTATSLMLGYFPYQKIMRMMPPLRIKVLTTSFEQGLNNIANDTLFNSTFMKDNTEIGPMMPKSMVQKFWCKEDKTLYLKNGSRMEWMTSEQVQRLHAGTNFDVLLCDEEPGKKQYIESVRGLRNAKGGKGGKILWGFTPPFEVGKGPSWTKYDKFDEWQAGHLPTCNIITACMADNPSIPEEHIEEIKRELSDEEFRVRFYGEFPTWGRMVHPEFSDKIWNPESGEGNLLPASWKVPFGDEAAVFEFALDWHDSKEAAAVWTVETKDGDVVVYDELTPEMAKDKTIRELTEIVFDLEGGRFGKFSPYRIRRFGDPKMKDKSNAEIRGYNAWDRFRQSGLRLAEGWNRQPGTGISIVNDFITGDRKNHPRLFVRENCRNTRLHLKNHYWMDEGKPDIRWSDYSICVRYIVQQKARKVKTGMMRSPSKWPLTSYGGDPRFGPYMGTHVKKRQRVWM